MGNRILSRDGNVLRVDFRAPYVAVPGASLPDHITKQIANITPEAYRRWLDSPDTLPPKSGA